jgi:hypothetical protein
MFAPPSQYGWAPPVAAARLAATRRRRSGGVILAVGLALLAALAVGGLVEAGGLTALGSFFSSLAKGAGATTSAQDVYHDPLTSPTGGWLNDSAACTFERDGYHVHGGRECPAPYGLGSSDVDVSVQARLVSGGPKSGYGIAVREDGSEGYALVIVNGGFWAFAKGADKSDTILLSGRRPDLIKSGSGATNTLEVRATGTHFVCTINGVKVGEVDDSTYASGAIGLGASPDGADVVYTNFSLTVL